VMTGLPAGPDSGGRFRSRRGRVRTAGSRLTVVPPAPVTAVPPARPPGVSPSRPPVRAAQPLRLTRRGRMAVVGLSVLLVSGLSVGLATAAEAAHGRPGAVPGGRYVARVQVLPGQSLWSLAEAYDPATDPRQVVARIQQLNSMAGAQVQAGQLLWVPRG
jgi:hypothetical protein